MKKQFRLTRPTDFKRVRRFGKSYAHSLVVLYVTVSGETLTRVGVSAGRWVGGAVERNRAKRLLREAMRELYPQIQPGNDLLLIARAPLANSNLSATQAALVSVLQRSRLIT